MLDEDEQDSSNLIIRCLLEGLPLNVARRGHLPGASASSSQSFLTESSNQECSIHPSSVLHVSMRHLFKKEKKEFETPHHQQINSRESGNRQEQQCHRVIFSEIIQTSKNYVRHLTDVSDV